MYTMRRRCCCCFCPFLNDEPFVFFVFLFVFFVLFFFWFTTRNVEWEILAGFYLRKVETTTTTIECERIRYKLPTSLVAPTTSHSLGFPLRDSVLCSRATTKTFDLQTWFWMYGIRRTTTTTTESCCCFYSFSMFGGSKCQTDDRPRISNGDNKIELGNMIAAVWRK